MSPMLTTVGRNALQPGAFVSFTYRIPNEVARTPQKRPVMGQPVVQQVSNPNKEIMILHPNWQGKVHGVDLKRITPAQVEVLKLVMDPETKNDQAKLNKYPLVRDILNRMNPVEVIKNPISFYSMMIKPFLNRADAYRIFFPDRMHSLKMIDDSKVAGAMINPRPLFGPKK